MNYEKLLEKARNAYKNCATGAEKRRLETIFPELRDEDTIMKELLYNLIVSNDNTPSSKEIFSVYGKTKEDCLAWLEKQGEQNETNISEILKQYPRETELYSPLYGKLWLAEVDENEIITCYKHCLDEGCTRATLEQEDTVSFYFDGTIRLPDFSISKECMLFLYNNEKQGEQKPIEKVEPKFKVRDWIICKRFHPALILNINKNKYEIEFTDNGAKGFQPIDFIDRHYHLWTIEDAKEGDVLSYVTDKGDLLILIYESLYKPYEGHVHYHAILENNKFFDKGTCCISIDNLKPATKEQRDLLFKEMEKSGYKWDVNRKEIVSVLKY